MARQVSIPPRDVIVGEALPYSIYSSDRTLLLAQGQIVSARVRDALLRHGLREAADAASNMETQRVELPTPCPLQLLRAHYASSFGSSRIGFRMSRDDGSESFTAWVIGTHEQRGLILSAPISRDNQLVAVAEAQTWIFRAFYGTAAFRFAGVIRRVMLDPYPYFHLQLPQNIDMRRVRQRTRAQVCIAARVQLAKSVEAVIVDLSSGGMRLAMKQTDVLHKDQTVNVAFSITVLDKVHEIRAAATVVTLYGTADQRHPDVVLYGLSLLPGSDFDRMLQHAYVQERLVDELDSTWKMLAGSTEPTMPDPGIN